MYQLSPPPASKTCSVLSSGGLLHLAWSLCCLCGTPRVWDCHIPGHGFSSGPWQESGPIWAFVVTAYQACWFFNCWHRNSLNRSPFRWRCCLERTFLQQDSPWSPCASTALTQVHTCVVHMLCNLTCVPLLASSDSLSPTELLVVLAASHQSVGMPQQEVYIKLSSAKD